MCLGKVTTNKYRLGNLQQAFRVLFSPASLLPHPLLHAAAEESLTEVCFAVGVVVFHIANSMLLLLQKTA